MTTLNDFNKTDLVDDHVAADVNNLIAAALRAEYANTETISATKELADSDTPFQVLTPSGADRTVELAPEATSNHVTVILCAAGASYDLVVKDDSGSTTYATLDAGEWALCMPVGGSVWKVQRLPAESSLTVNASTITTGNLSCVEENVYNCTIAGLTANRNAVLPAPSAAGKRIRINILDGDASYALLIIGDTGVTINGGSAATEWSRLFIIGESVTLQSTSTTNWLVIADGRKPCIGIAERQAAQSIDTGSATKVALDAEIYDRGDIVDVTTNDRINIRRSGVYDLSGFASMGAVMDDQEQVQCHIYIDGALARPSQNWVSSGGANQNAFTHARALKSLTAGQYVELYILHNEGAAQNTDTTYYPSISAVEIL